MEDIFYALLKVQNSCKTSYEKNWCNVMETFIIKIPVACEAKIKYNKTLV